MSSKKNIFEDEEKIFKITKIVSHHGFRSVTMVRRRLGTNQKNTNLTKVSSTQKGGKSRTK